MIHLTCRNSNATFTILPDVTMFAGGNDNAKLKDTHATSIDMNDIRQQVVADCWFWVEVLGLANKRQQNLFDRFEIANGKVRLHYFKEFDGPNDPPSGRTEWFTIGMIDTPYTVLLSGDRDKSKYEFWPQMLTHIFTKAFPVKSDDGGLTRASLVRKNLDNQSTSWVPNLANPGDDNLSKQIKDTLDANKPVSLTTPQRPSDSPVGNKKQFTLSKTNMVFTFWNHAYTVVSIDTKGNANPADDEVTIANPHGALDEKTDSMQTLVIPVADLPTMFRNMYK